jgi:hypothetical protein
MRDMRAHGVLDRIYRMNRRSGFAEDEVPVLPVNPV